MKASGATATTRDGAAAPVLLAYDGSELAAIAIEHAGKQLDGGREALSVCVWRPVDVGFVLPPGRRLQASEASEVRRAAEETAARGAALAEAAGFRARAIAIEAVPTWKGIVEIAERQGADLIVFGSHCRHGLAGHLHGSVVADVMRHCAFSVLVVR
jgi:nucleotide-binding universal stress UspA family protein